MSVIELVTAKEYLDVIHSGDDAKLQRLLDGAEDEAAQYMGRDSLFDLISDKSGELPAAVVTAVMLLLQAVHQAPADDIPKYRSAAETKLAPYRIGWGA